MRTRRSSMVGSKGGGYTCCFTKLQRKYQKVWGRGNVKAKACIQNLHGQHVQSISLEIVSSVRFWHLSGNRVMLSIWFTTSNNMCYSWISEIWKLEIGINRNRNYKEWSTAKHETEIRAFCPQLYVNHKCSMWAPCITRHTSIVYSIPCHTRSSFGPCTSAMASVMRTRRSSMVGGKGGWYTLFYKTQEKKKSQGVRSGERGGQGKHSKSSRPACPIPPLGNRVFSLFLTSKW